MATTNKTIKTWDLDDIFIFVPCAREIVRIAEGTEMDRKSLESNSNGYVDLIEYWRYSMEPHMPEVGNGPVIRKRLVREEFGELSKAVPAVLEDIYGNVPAYTVLA